MQSANLNSATALATNNAATISNLRTSLMNVQMALDEATNELNRLRLENATLKAVALPNRGPKKNKRMVVSTPIDYSQELLATANKFTLLDFVWVKMSAFGNPCPPSPIPIEICYSDDINTLLYIRYRLYECFPDTYHGYLEGLSEFATNFGRSAQQQRSNIISKLRTAAPIIFADTYPEISSHLLSNPEDRGMSEACRRLYLSGDTSSMSQKLEPLLAPIIYAGGNITVEGIFQNEVLFSIGRCSLFGHTAIRGKIPKNSQGVKWGIKSVTSGLISFCCIAAVFLVSRDVTFEEVGGKSEINYRSAFLAYKQRLEMHENSPRFQKIIKLWNYRLFGDTGVEGEEFNFADAERNTRSAAIDAALLESPRLDLVAISGPTPMPDLPSSIASGSSLSANAPFSSVSRALGEPFQATLTSSRTTGATSSRPSSTVFTLPASNPGSVLSFDQDDSSDDSIEMSDGPRFHHGNVLAPITQTSSALAPVPLLVTQPLTRPSSPALPIIIVSPGPTSTPESTPMHDQRPLVNEGPVNVPKRGRPKKTTQVKGQDNTGMRRSSRNQRG